MRRRSMCGTGRSLSQRKYNEIQLWLTLDWRSSGVYILTFLDMQKMCGEANVHNNKLRSPNALDKSLTNSDEFPANNSGRLKAQSHIPLRTYSAQKN